jgi:DNA-binding transcriptional ArsR family regulator
VELLRRSALTANELATQVGVTHDAVRGHLAALLHAGLVRQGGLRRGGSRPAMGYELVPRTDAVPSRAYIPFVAHPLRALSARMPQPELDELEVPVEECCERGERPAVLLQGRPELRCGRRGARRRDGRSAPTAHE